MGSRRRDAFRGVTPQPHDVPTEKVGASEAYPVVASCLQILGTNLSIEGNGFEVGSAFTIDIGLRHGDYTATDTPIEIPKNNENGIWSFIDMPVDFPYHELDVTVNIDHDDISELQVLLYSPQNTAINLHRFTGEGVSGPTAIDDLETVLVSSGVLSQRGCDMTFPG